jgi:plasmid stabilization system protein ParE
LATADLERYWAHIARDDKAAADNFLAVASLAEQRVKQFPSLGRRRQLAQPFSAWMDFYRETPAAIGIVRILHGTMNVPTRLLEPPE